MKKNENYSNNNINYISKEYLYSKNIKFLPQLEKDICILINYIRTNPLDFSNNLIKNNKNKNLTEEQIDIIKFLEEKYNKEQLLPFHEIPEISEAAKNLLYNISQNNLIYGNKKIKSTSLNLRTRLSNYGLRTGRIYENVIFHIKKPEDIINYILKDENGRNMLLSNKMKFIGIGCCILPINNQICSVIDIVQDFMPYKKSKIPKMNIIINNTNNELIPNIKTEKHNNQRKKNIIYENINKSPEISSIYSKEPKQYKSYNIIINNNKIIPLRKNNDENDNFFNLNNNTDINGLNSCKIGLNKSKSVYGFDNKYGFKFSTGSRGTNNINKCQKLNRKEKLEILHKINQRKNNNSMAKHNINFENLIPLSPEYSKKEKNKNINNNNISPISPQNSRKIFEQDINNFEFNETMPNSQSPYLDYDLIMLKKQIKEELKQEVKNEIKNEIKKEFNTENGNKINKIFAKDNIIYHKRYKSDFFKNKSKNEKSQKINQNINNMREEHRIKNKNEIKQLIRLYNKEKDSMRNKNNVNNINDNQKISKFFFGYKNNNNQINNNNEKKNLFLIKYKKAKPKDQTFKLIKNRTNISRLCLNKQNENKKKENNYIINSYKNKSDKKTKELSIEVYLNDNNYMKENKKYKTPEKSLNRKINEDIIKLNSDINCKKSPYNRPKIYFI